MRWHTGGQVDPPASPSGSANRKLSPYNALINAFTLASTQPLATGDTTMPAIVASPADALPAGIATYTNSLNLSERNAFMTFFLDALIVLACLTTFLALFASVKLIVRRKLHGYPIALRRTYLLVAAALLLYVSISWRVMKRCLT
jgi:hypothetical protein